MNPDLLDALASSPVAVDHYAAKEELLTGGSIIDCIRTSSAIPGWLRTPR